VINEDHIQGGKGFGSHPHRDMEIITYIVSGALEHQDSMGTKAVIKPGEVQRMSAGTGVMHSEYNRLTDQDTHLLQIWIQPNVLGSPPSYGQKSFENELNSKEQVLVVSKDGRDGSLAIQQDADLYVSRLKAGGQVDFKLRPGRGAWVQVIKGDLDLNGQKLGPGDAVAAAEEPRLLFKSLKDTEFLLFDLA
jgi:redox-sensitive bicupin YhaK (pirin superfamily)